MSGRDCEIAAFRRAIGELESAADEPQRIRAFGRNHDLWSLLVKDLALEGNTLPEALKTQLIALGLWSMQYSIAAILGKLSAEPVLAVNRNVLEGLLGQTVASAAAAGVDANLLRAAEPV